MSFFDQLAGSISKVTKDLGNRAQELTDTAKLNSKISDANNLIKSTYTAIGEAIYLKNKDNPDSEMAEQFKVIEDALKTIEEAKAQINAIKGVKNCPKCGAAVASGDAFCPACGEKLASDEAPETAEDKEEEAKKCSKCGELLDKDAVFCTSCGAPVEEEPGQED